MSKQDERWSRNGLGTGSTDTRTWYERRGCQVFKSYAAVIGFTDRQGNSYVTDERWSMTTSKHQSHLCGLLDVDQRTPEDQFKELFKQLVEGQEADHEDHTPIFG